MNILISIIVPIYKVERYLRHCIDSLLSQDYQHIEIILVDDGSPDSCGKMVDECRIVCGTKCRNKSSQR